jgi:SpoVK/Ycf46/Vps4 family AAA+-type ATPase
MNISVQALHLRKLAKANEKVQEALSYRSDHQKVEVDIDALTEDEFRIFKATLEKVEDGSTKSALNKIKIYENLKVDPTGKRIGTVEQLEQALKLFIGKLDRHWLIKIVDGEPLPVHVSLIHYTPYDERNERPAYTAMKLEWQARNGKSACSVSWNNCDVQGPNGGKTVIEILQEAGYFQPTPEALKRWQSSVDRYKGVRELNGQQYHGIGEASICGGYWSSGSVSLVRDGIRCKVVMDDVESDDGTKDKDDEDGSSLTTSDAFWHMNKQDAPTVVLPLHPYVKVFELSEHNFVEVHVNQLIDYEWDTKLGEKLILPPDVKDLVTILCETASEQLDDIIKGKTGGTIVFATGEPGTGKTLTAEVFSEVIKRPLYVVQCSQLGTNENELEKELKLVLRRAQRWGAILLIDEADVYVRERGDDIQQNAIVGVFLRVLEYYRGILFLTSNRATLIDDAILSRATAHIRYTYPDADDLKRIWQVLADQYAVKITAETLKAVLTRFPRISGRNVKNLLKLAKRLASKRKCAVDAKLIEYVAKFQDIPEKTP